MVDLSEELAAALESPRVQAALSAVVRDALRDQLGPRSGAPAGALIDAACAAKMLAMSTAAVRKAAARGTLPCHRLGRRLRFRPEEILRAAKLALGRVSVASDHGPR